MKKIKTFGEFVNESETEFSNYNPSLAMNEAEEGGGILDYFTSARNFGKKIKEWEQLYIEKKELEKEKVLAQYELEDARDAKIIAYKEKTSGLVTQQLDSKNLSGQKRATARKSIEADLKTKEETIKAKYDNQIKAHMAKYDNNIQTMGENINGLSEEYPIKDTTISAKFTAYEKSRSIDINLKYDNELIDLKREHDFKKNPDNEAVIEKEAKDRKQKLKDEQAEATKKAQYAQDRAARKEKEWEQKMQSTDQKVKDAAAKLDAFEKAYAKYVRASGEILRLEAEEAFGNSYSYEKLMEIVDKNISLYEDEAADAAALKQARKDLSDANKDLTEAAAKLTKTVFKDLGQTPEQAEQSVEDYAAEVDELKKSFEKKARKSGEEIEARDSVLQDDPEETPTGGSPGNGTGTVSGSGGSPGNGTGTGGSPGNVNTSFDVSGFDKYAMSENKNVLSFEEFVNESRKNGFTF